jgi:hypothetical protein
VKHASAARIDQAAALLKKVRAIDRLVEKSPGCFYRQGKAVLHFHEDGEALWADVKQASAWVRMPANSSTEIDRICRLLSIAQQS